eukprot:TRINITY_DN1578_c0_g1_i1.p1 TRINITY_DN1578_c0_g1~~TRINITY_DN1578_c0_g1_i1.p1  ORF type:complete len:441 (+),score=66.98 TRINITY_DN1578_c0_g1_i1:53-1324(+)
MSLSTSESETSNDKGVIAFFNVPLYGHVNPSLDLAGEMVNRGYTVYFYAAEKFRNTIENTGCHFVDYGQFCDYQWQYSRENTNIFATTVQMLEACESIIKGLGGEDKKFNAFFELHEEPIAILYDVSAIWGRLIALKLDIPNICCFPGMAPQIRFYLSSKRVITRYVSDLVHGRNFLKDAQNNIRTRIYNYIGLHKQSLSTMFGGAETNIVFTSSYFQPRSDVMLENFVFTGPALLTRKATNMDFPWDRVNEEANVVYVSMGTLYYQDPAFFNMCFEAFGDKPKYSVIISVGRTTDIESLGPIPSNIIVMNYVPQLDILEKANAFITHGGMNSISEACFYGVPVVIIPKTIEQVLNSKRMVELGAGVDMSKMNVTPQSLLQQTNTILDDPSYAEATIPIHESFISAGGVQLGADTVEAVIESY